MPQVANIVAAGILLLTVFFVWSTLRVDLERSIIPHGDSNRPTYHRGADWRARASNEPNSAVMSKPTNINHLKPPPSTLASPSGHDSPFAYVFYATTDEYACSALVNIYRLQHVLNSRYPIHVLVSTDVSEQLIQAFRGADAQVHMEKPPTLALSSGESGYYKDCLLKLLAFKLHRLSPGLERVLAFDADQLIVRNLDDLFTGLPHIDLAAPRAYWLAKDFLASTFMMIELSDRLWASVRNAFSAVGNAKFDMDIVNDLLGDEVMMLSGEYVTLNSHWEDWNLPKWHHPTHALNTTTIDKLNKLAEQARLGIPAKRQVAVPPGNSSAANASAHAAVEHTRPISEPDPVAIPSPAIDMSNPAAPPPQKPRFPDAHPLSKELFELENAAAVIHFSALGKPWTVTEGMLQWQRADAHPLLAEQFRIWRETAAKVCPSGFGNTGSYEQSAYPSR